jgi:hypothetical protein
VRDLVREPDCVAIDAEQRRDTVGQIDPRQLDHAKAAGEELQRQAKSFAIGVPSDSRGTMMMPRRQRSNRGTAAGLGSAVAGRLRCRRSRFRA